MAVSEKARWRGVVLLASSVGRDRLDVDLRICEADGAAAGLWNREHGHALRLELGAMALHQKEVEARRLHARPCFLGCLGALRLR